MKFIRQPKDSNLCGQACVAMICGISLEEAVSLSGARGKTRTHHLKKVLTDKGVDHGDRRIIGFPKGETAILFWRSDEGCHWTVWHKKKYYDPAAGVFRSIPKHLSNARVTSYLPIGPECQGGD